MGEGPCTEVLLVLAIDALGTYTDDDYYDCDIEVLLLSIFLEP